MLRRLLSPAVLVAVAIVILGSTGTAIAAHHYVITSTKQISPKVLKKLHGATGPAGAPGTPGAPGTNGLGLTADQTLPTGNTETGTFAGNGATGQDITVDIEFRPKWAASLPAADVHFVTTPTAACPGTSAAPTATAGTLCIYLGGISDATYASTFRIDNSIALGASSLGAVIFFTDTGPDGRTWGTWAVTAP
jgi:hypothetical protein